MSVPADNPIRDEGDDALGRATAAQSFARQVLALDASEGVVVGVLGPWGSGKTSFINLARKTLSAEATVLDFNPWMFSGAEQLVGSFFAELSAQLKLRPGLKQLGEDLADYGEAFAGLGWLPVVGPWIERGRGVSRLVARLLRRRREGVAGRRDKLTRALDKLSEPIVVVIDDVDRLSTAEIRDVFKLVRLTASFPNVIYLLAFDRERVERALEEDGVPGRDYLEKILQVAIDLPTVPHEVLSRQVFSALDDVIGEAPKVRELDQGAWPDVFMEIIRPQIRNMRDVRRFAAGARGTIHSVGDQIALADLLALEAVRIFLPDVFTRFEGAVDALTTPAELTAGVREESDERKRKIEDLVAVAPNERQDSVRALIERLFPFASRHLGGSHYGPDWQARFLRDRRIGHEAILRLYLDRVAGEQLASFYDAERAFAVMNDREKFDELLRALEADRREDVIRSLETYEDEYRSDQVVPATVVLWNLAPELPDRPRGIFDLDTRLVVSRVTYRLLRSLDDKSAVEAAVREILPELKTLSGKQEVISDVGYREGAGHKLVTEEAAKKFEREWREEVRKASADELTKEDDLLRTLLLANKERDESEPPVAVPDDPSVTLALLNAAKSESRSQTMGSRAVRRSPRLAWDALTALYGDEETLKARIETLKASDLEVDEDLRALVDKYVEGWRPDDA